MNTEIVKSFHEALTAYFNEIKTPLNCRIARQDLAGLAVAIMDLSAQLAVKEKELENK